jgi:hypothetical protein
MKDMSRARITWIAAIGALGCAALVFSVTLVAWAPKSSPVASAPALSPLADLSSDQLFLHGTGGQANTSTLFLDAQAPSASTEKFRDSSGVKFSGGNLWAEVGTWTAALGAAGSDPAMLTALDVWLGLKNSDDIGTAFDLRAEVHQDQMLLASGDSRCIRGLTRNAAQAKPVNLPLAGANPLTGAGTFSLKLLTRIGTNADGTRCSGSGATHSNAVGVRLYFDAVNRSSKLLVSAALPRITWSQEQLDVILSPGESLSKNVTFTSSLAIQNIVIEAVPEIAPFVTIQPASLGSVPSGQPQPVHLTFSIPPNASLGTFEGTVHVRWGNRTLPQTLKISLHVWHAFSSPTTAALGYDFRFPPVLASRPGRSENEVILSVSGNEGAFPEVSFEAYAASTDQVLALRDSLQNSGLGNQKIESVSIDGFSGIKLSGLAALSGSGQWKVTRILVVDGSRVYLISADNADDILNSILPTVNLR